MLLNVDRSNLEYQGSEVQIKLDRTLLRGGKLNFIFKTLSILN